MEKRKRGSPGKKVRDTGKTKGRVVGAQSRRVKPTEVPGATPSAAWLALVARQKEGPLSAVVDPPRQRVKHEDRPITWPDGKTASLRESFPGLYPPADLDAQRDAVATIPRGRVGWDQWPKPCPDPMCCAPHLTDGGFCTDPISGQRHHWLCCYWDRTGRTPF